MRMGVCVENELSKGGTFSSEGVAFWTSTRLLLVFPSFLSFPMKDLNDQVGGCVRNNTS